MTDENPKNRCISGFQVREVGTLRRGPQVVALDSPLAPAPAAYTVGPGGPVVRCLGQAICARARHLYTFEAFPELGVYLHGPTGAEDSVR